MDWCRYRFHSRWDLPGPPAAVLAVLRRAEEYPRWWRQVRAVVPAPDGRTGEARFRSLLPYTLTVTVSRAPGQQAPGVLEVDLGGDLEGWARWTLVARGAGTRVLFDQVVDVRRPAMRRLAVPGRPFFRLNHRWMMRGGRRGLRALLAAERGPGRRSGGERGTV
ncbi:SRPBCC family protein [Streptomyces sp. NPDC002490]|uniref:SRPBCC family protein n=1 Tax=Streptomyces sp. NPDC002490 TaxID=3154416 RepID=UPI00331AE4CB